MNEEAGSQDVIAPQPPSMAISPDLEALIEHDERTRGSQIPLDSAHSSGSFFQSPRSGSFTTAFPVGLPPPPRRKGGSRPTTPKDSPEGRALRRSDLKNSSPASARPGSSGQGSDISNPYLNAPPKIVQVDRPSTGSSSKTDQSLPLSPLSPPSVMAESLRRALDGIADLPSPASPASQEMISRDTYDTLRPLQTPIVTREDSASPQFTESQTASPTQRTYSTLPRVDKLIGKGKSIFSISASQTQSTSQDSGDRSKLSKYADSMSTVALGTETGQTGTLSDASQKQPPGASYSTISPLTESSRQTSKSKRPSLSHAAYSWDSSGKSPSASPTSPATPTRRRISISSITNSPTDIHHRINSRTTQNQTSSSPSRESFIDLFSPSSPEFARSPSSSRSKNSPTRLRRPVTPQTSFGTGTGSSKDRAPLSPTASDMTSQPKLQGNKPPIPTAPKPSFSRASSDRPGASDQARRPSPNPMSRLVRQASPASTRSPEASSVPPTTNFLNPNERADLVKKSRKLAQVFGTTPGASVLSQRHDESQPDITLLAPNPASSPGKRRHIRGAVSVSGSFQSSDNDSTSTWDVPAGTQYLSASGRRHSAPLSPDQYSFLQDAADDENNPIIQIGSEHNDALSEWSSSRASNQKGPASPTSFIDLSDEDTPNDNTSVISSSETSRRRRNHPAMNRLPSASSILESTTPEEREEAERKRKRDKLAKLHRFLGSRVPVELVLGLAEGEASLPLPLPQTAELAGSKLGTVSEDEEPRKAWLSRRRSSSATVFASHSDDLDRLKEDLNEEEKAINVRRAQKMEKVFGDRPPQTLYHTRHTPSPSLAGPALISISRAEQPPSPKGLYDRNPNQSAYKLKSKKHYRPGTSESAQQLLPDVPSGSLDWGSTPRQSLTIPDVYTHYQHSLHSLNDIIDRDDRASLAELHQYLQGDAPEPPVQEFVRSPSRTSSVKSERRRSMPSSIISVSMEYPPTPKPEITDFQVRRRRAAKLTHFFGVDYKQIVNEVLDSIEKGVEEERKRGTLQPEEVEALLRKLRTLKTKRNGIF